MSCNYIIRNTLCIICLLLMCSVSGLDISRMRIAHPSGSGEIFHGGVYIYIATIATDVLMENHIRLMAQQGLTHLYVAKYSANITADEVVQWCRKYRTYVSFQSNDYYTGDETPSQLAAKAASAASFMGSLWDDPEFLTCSVKEEPTIAQIDGLFQDPGGYYKLINNNFSSYGGVAPIYLLHNYYISYASQKAFKPLMTGTDRHYVYEWNYGVFANGYQGYLTSPRKSLNIMNDYMHTYSSCIDPDCQWSTAVLLGTALRSTVAKSDLEAKWGSTSYQRWLALSRYNSGEGNQGLKESGDNILSWGRYMPPANCMSCQVWLAVARGYRSVFIWKCDPYSSNLDMMGSDFKGTNVLNEYGSTVRELQKFGWAINHMEYQPSALYISYTDSPLYTTYSGNFTIPGYNGRIVVLVNADVGTWCSNTPYYFSGSDVFRFDDYCNVKTSDYTAKTAVRSIAINNNAGDSMYDLDTGTLIGSSSGSIGVLPGKGKFIFIGNSTELAEIRAKCGMTTITAHSGIVPNRETTPGNIQIYYAVAPKSTSVEYVLSPSTAISLNKRYRLHVTAKSSNGARLGALPGYYSGGIWNTYHINLAIDNSDLWNKTLTATPTTFVSQDFTVSSGTAARVFLYRSNQQGTIQIDDAWIEDCNSHRQVDTEWMDNSITHPVNNGETYHVYARARNYPCNNTTFSVNIYEYDINDNLLGYYDTTPAISNETLTEQPTVFKGVFQKINASAHHVRVKFIKSSGSGSVILESACVGQIIQ